MSRAVGRLNALQVKNTRAPGFYPDGGNLYLQIGRSGGKSWIFRFTRNGRSHDMGFSRFICDP